VVFVGREGFRVGRRALKEGGRLLMWNEVLI